MSREPKFLAQPGPQIVLFFPARPGINILQNLYNGLNFILLGRGHKPEWNFVLITAHGVSHQQAWGGAPAPSPIFEK